MLPTPLLNFSYARESGQVEVVELLQEFLDSQALIGEEVVEDDSFDDAGNSNAQVLAHQQRGEDEGDDGHQRLGIPMGLDGGDVISAVS